MEVVFLGPGCGSATACVVQSIALSRKSEEFLAGKAILDAGDFTVRVRNGPEGRPSNSLALSISPERNPNENQAPTAGLTMSYGGQSATEGGNLNLTVSPGQVVSVSFSASRSSDPDGSIVGWEWRINGTLVSTASSFSFGLGVGNHVVSLKVTDNDGASATSPSGTGVVITEEAANQAPTAGLTMSYGGQSATEGGNLNLTVSPGQVVSVSFSASRSSDPDGSIVGWEWRINGTLVSRASSFSFGLGVGNHVVSLKVTDNDGASATSPSGTGVVITEEAANQAPTAGLTMSYGGRSATEGGNLNLMVSPGQMVSVSFSASRSSDPDGSIVGWEWRINGTLVSTASSFSFGLGVGNHVVSLKVTDNDGASATSPAGTGVVITEEAANQAPTAGLTMSYGGRSATEGGNLNLMVSPGQMVSVSFSASRSSDPDGSIVGWEWRINGTLVSTASSFSFGLGVGNHVVSLKVTDNDGASATSPAGTGVVITEEAANQAPTAGLTMSYGGQSATEGGNLNLMVSPGQMVSVSFSASRSSDPDGSIVGWEWRINGTLVSTASSFSFGLGVGNHVVSLKVTDNDGASATSPSGTGVVITEEAANQAPTAGLTMSYGGQSATEGGNLNLTVSPGQVVSVSFSASRSSDPDGSIVGWEWRINGTLVSTASSFSFGLGVGNHVVSLKVTDNDGASATSPSGTGVVITEEAANQAPTAGLTMSYGGRSATEGGNLNLMVSPGQMVSVSFSASRSSDPDGSIVGWEWRINGTLVSTASSFSFGLGVGNHVVSLKVTDNDGASATSPAGTGVVVTESAPEAPVVNPSGGTWTMTPQNVSVSSIGAQRIYYTIRTTIDGSIPADPPEPSSGLNDGFVGGSSGVFQVFASPGQYKKLKVRFRGEADGVYGPSSPTYSYSIDLR